MAGPLLGLWADGVVCYHPDAMVRVNRLRRLAPHALVVLALFCVGASDPRQAADELFDGDHYQTDLPDGSDGEGGGATISIGDDSKTNGDSEGPDEPNRGASGGCTGAPAGGGSAGGSPGSERGGKDDRSGQNSGSESSAKQNPPPQRVRIPPEVSAVAEMAMWAFLVVLVLLAILWAVRNFTMGPVEVTESDEVDDDGESEIMVDLRERTGDRDPDDLAAEEKYEEAIHAMLLRALESLVDTTPALRRPSLTSREILSAVDRDDVRAELRPLVGAVEMCIFALHPADREMYEHTREHFDRFCSLVSTEAAA